MHSVLVSLFTCLFTVTVTAYTISGNEVLVRPMDLYQQQQYHNIQDSFLDGRIINGTLAANNQFPYQVALMFTSGNIRWFCGGSIISKNYILTAAHCTNQAKSVNITMGTVDRKNPKVQMEVSGKYIKQHKNYNDNWLWNDISLIEVPDIQFSDGVKPVALPSKADINSKFTGDIVITSGWGKIKDSLPGTTDKLQYVLLQITSNNVCAAVYTTLSVKPSTICADTIERGSTCNGDSGGPLVEAERGILIGVTSFGPRIGCEAGYPVAFTRVTYYLDWIQEQTGMSL